MTTQHTPGPWAWMGSNHAIYLATTHSGRRYVMGFQRMGLHSAQPSFRVGERIVPAAELVQFEVGDGKARGFKVGRADSTVYRLDIDGIDAPDARLIAASPTMYEALESLRPFVQAAADAGDGEAPEHLARIDAAIAKARGE